MSKITELLEAAGSDPRATAECFSLVYDELRRLAATHLSHEASGNTLQPTALVHEAYLRLVGSSPEGGDGPRWECRAHFFAAAAQAMRRILIESARCKSRQKRGGGCLRVALDPDQIAAPELSGDLLALDEALTALAAVEPKIAELVTLRYFGQLSLKDAAAALGIPARTADAHWAYARAWLLAEMKRGDEEGS